MATRGNRLTRYLAPCLCAGLVLAGCSQGVDEVVSSGGSQNMGTDTGMQMPSIAGFGPTVTGSSSGLAYQVVARETFDSIPFDEVLDLEPGTPMRLLLNRRGTEVRAYTVTFEAAVKDGTERLIIARVPEELIIGAGDSGSPLLTEDGRIAGLLCYGWSFNNYQFAARAIADVTSAPANGKPLEALGKSKKASSMGSAMPLSYHASGFSKEIVKQLDTDTRYRGFLLSAIENGVREPRGPAPGLARRAANGVPEHCDELAPGMSIAVHEMTGDLLNLAAVGVAGYVTDNRIYGFGHSYWMASGELSKPVSLASMETIIESGYQAFKMTSILDDYVGAFVGDHPHAIVIDPGEKAATVKVEVSTSVDLGDDASYTHRISHDPEHFWERMLMEYALYYSVLHPMAYRRARGWAQAEIAITTEEGEFDTTMRIPHMDTTSDDEMVVNCHLEYDTLSDSLVKVCDSVSYATYYEELWGESCEWDGNASDIAQACVYAARRFVSLKAGYGTSELESLHARFNIHLDRNPDDDTCYAGGSHSSYYY
ncbi:MAG: hypothetical protein GF418_10735 [Chitinivibrionales bacterium]|nr:hypothetical protein [Chitinivibrionales bacterium]MBD3396090.1 hypothetical protein [Chitinivibrionales bacterium]